MNAYLITVLLLVPAPSGVHQERVLLPRVLMPASSIEDCQRHMRKVIEERSAEYADAIRISKGRVIGKCQLQPGPTP